MKDRTEILAQAVVLIILSFVFGLYTMGMVKLSILFISILAAQSFLIGYILVKKTPIPTPDENILYDIWVHGLVSGAIIISTGYLLIPRAVSLHPKRGSIGIAIGFLVAYVLHHISHQLFHHHNRSITARPLAVNLTAHSLAAGIVLGILYTELPGLSIALGIAIISHKLPAGIGLSQEYNSNVGAFELLGPSLGVAIGASIIALSGFNIPTVVLPIISGASAGLFLHIGADLLPECASGRDVSCSVDRQRRHAILSSLIGAVVFVLLNSLV